MKHINFYLDFISPYAYLAFEKLPQALAGLSYSVAYKPVLFAGFLQHHGQLGPAEIAPKRDWTYRQVQWLAHAEGIPLDMPLAHPFNPLPLLRLALAESQLKLSTAAAHVQALDDRFAAGKLRNDTTHLAEEARFQLQLRGNARLASRLAAANYAVQREPRDARVLLEAALAAGDGAAAQPARDWLNSSRFEDAHLRQLGQATAALSNPANDAPGLTR